MNFKQIIKNELNESTQSTEKKTKVQIRDEMKSQLTKDGYTVKNGTTQSSIFIVQPERGTSSRAQMFDKIVEQYGGEYIEKSSLSSAGVVKLDNGVIIAIKPANKTGDSNRDDVREIGVCLLAAALIEGCNSKQEQQQFIERVQMNGYDKLFLGKTVKLTDVCQFLLTNKSAFNSSYQCAKAIVDHFGKAKLAKYEIHHKSKQYNQIRANGKRLSQLTADKWNPSDFFFIMPNTNVNMHMKTIGEYNKFIGSDDKIIGVSLKESEKGAAHGKCAISNVVKQFKLHTTQHVFTAFDQQYKSWLVKSLKRFGECNNPDVKFIVPKNVNTIDQVIEANQRLKDDKKISGAYFNSVPLIMQFLENNCDPKTIQKIVEYAYSYSKSALPDSCPHNKVMGTKYEKTSPHQADIEVKNIYIPLVKETQVVFDIVADGVKIKFQCRVFTASGKPQFNILVAGYKPNSIYNVIPASQIDSLLK